MWQWFIELTFPITKNSSVTLSQDRYVNRLPFCVISDKRWVLWKSFLCLEYLHRRRDTLRWRFSWYESEVLVAQSCLTLCNPMDCSLPGSSVHGILQARIPEWVIIPFSRGSSRPRDWTWVSWIASRFFTTWATGKKNLSIKLSTF